MNVIKAVMKDMEGWLHLASEVEYLFGPMVNEPKFIQALEKSIYQQSAFCVRVNDGVPGDPLLGGVMFSSSNAPYYKIGWLAVSSEARKQGVATAIMNHILSRIETPAEISVITFGEDIPDGRPARRFHQKFGFLPLEETIPNGPEGGSRQKFRMIVN